MSKAATYIVKGVELTELQYFRWRHKAILQPMAMQDGQCVPGPRRELPVDEFCYSFRGTVYFGTNGGKASKTLAEIDADPHSEIVALEQFCDKRPTY